MESCGGCKTCEIACSFKHTGEFKPSVSSIRIQDKEDGLGFCVFLSDGESKTGLTCDGCVELDKPLCIQYCEKAEDLKEIIDAFLKQKNSGS